MNIRNEFAHVKTTRRPRVAIRLSIVAGLAAAMFCPWSNARAELTVTDLRCEYRVDPLGIDTRRAAAELGARVERARPGADGVPGARRLQSRGVGRRSGRPLGQRPGGLRPLGPRALRRQAARVAGDVSLEGPGVGQAGPAFRLERAGAVDDGPLGAGGLAGPMDRPSRRRRDAARPDHAVAAPAPRVPGRQARSPGDCLAVRPGAARVASQRPEGRRRRDGARLDQLPQAVPLRHLRRDRPDRAGPQRRRRHARQRDVQRRRRAVREVHGQHGAAEADRPGAAGLRRRHVGDARLGRDVEGRAGTDHV